MKRYINIHSHHASTHPDIQTVLSLYKDFADAERLQDCSLGLHPWYLEDVAVQMCKLEHYATLPQILAIGECGLDKVCATPWELQEKAFRLQIDLANKLNKPLVIHCVQAFNEAMAMLESAKVPVIFHGFQKNPELAKSLTDHGYYLSFGWALTEGRENATASLKNVPGDRFFLETDDGNFPIRDVYRAAAAIRQIDEEALVVQLQQNFKTVFGL